MPDLLGFGSATDMTRDDFGLNDHPGALDDGSVPVRLVWGFEDRIGDLDAIHEQAAALSNVEVVRVPGDHREPLVRPDRPVDELVAIAAASNIR